VQHNGHGGKSVIKINREPKLVNKYKLVDRNGVQIPFTTTISSFVEAKLTDGITYASSDAIEVTPPPNPPEMDISTSLRNPKNPNILIEARSQVLSYIIQLAKCSIEKMPYTLIICHIICHIICNM